MNNLILSAMGNIFDMKGALKNIFDMDGFIEVTLAKSLLVLLITFILGAILSAVYIFTHRKTGYLSSMPTTLIVLPIVVATVIMLVGSNYASAFALAGVFTLIRFRSEPGDPKDISYIFASVAAGLCCGMGYVAYAIIICLVLSAILLVIYFSKYGEPKKTDLKLKILIPENLNYESAFDDIFEEFGVKAYLDKVRTADFGTIYELIYHLKVNPGLSQKEFIDKLRTRNGNLNITLTLSDNAYTKNS